ncbi:NAD-dependent epimerase/dehydratase family protein [Halorubrum sp. SP9]|uniref:NAD-dependent epimerase/dehydratase family protein n=1 Tax=Halorubrum sp. SP9 TaxID=1537267 RepID=UPI0010F9D564|nr:NAD-dependent epimerase/dehydratase family protein [Halorubrum sp. SP9]TKX69930.1 NAD-dependent epimerase/dehydratase family protein [Halorubrum sp. SP9]
MNSQTHVLVTGGAGFVGSHIVDRLIDEGYQVTVLDNLVDQVHESKPDYLNDSVNYVWEDIRDREIVSDLLEQVDVVSHQASAVGVGQSMYQVEKYVDINTRGTAVMLDVIANEDIQIDKFVVASSMSIYGEGAYKCAECGSERYPNFRSDDQMSESGWEHMCSKCGSELEPIPTSESKPLDSTSVYAITKKDQEQLVRSVCRAYGIESVALRYFNIYGSRQSLSNPYTGVCAIFSSRIKNGNSPLVFEDGDQLRDFIHVSDVARANVAAIESDADDTALNIGTGNSVSIKKVANTLIDLYDVEGLSPEITNDYRQGDIRHCFADIDAATEALDWEPKMGFKEGMRELVEWGLEQDPDDQFDRAQRELEKKGLIKDS